MTMTKGEPPAGQADGTPARRSHVPGDGTAAADAIEQARRQMLHDVRSRKRTRIGADALMEALIRQGADTLFTYPGGVILPIYDILGDYPEIRHILVRHEQGGAHAADGYARASGKVGVCMGTSGPGATNLVTGIGTAQLDSVPMVAITGNVPSSLIGKDAFQEIDITGITLPMTKHNYLVRNADDIPRVVAEAFYIAKHGRPGPVHVDITKDALQQETRAEHPSLEDVIAGLPGFRPNLEGHPKQLKTAAKEIAQAKRPLILAGHGVLIAEAWDELRAFAEKTQIPVAWSLLGIGAMDEEHPLAYGYMGMHGWKHVNRAIQSADLLIAIGMRFDDRVTGSVRTYAPYARIIHADIDPAEIGKNVAVEVPIVGDAKNVLAGLTRLVPHVDPATRAEYLDQLAEWRDRVRGLVLARVGRLAERRALGRLRGRAHRRADGPRRHLRRGRGPEPDVARPLHRVPPAAQPHQLGRPGHDGLRGPGRDGRRARQPVRGDLGDLRRRRLPDDQPGADDPRRGPDPGQDRASSTTRSWA